MFNYPKIFVNLISYRHIVPNRRRFRRSHHGRAWVCLPVYLLARSLPTGRPTGPHPPACLAHPQGIQTNYTLRIFCIKCTNLAVSRY
jgi:hypothetical protein